MRAKPPHRRVFMQQRGRSAAAKAWRRISITAGAKNSLRPARSGCWAIRHAKRRRRKSRTCAAKTASSSRSWPRLSSRIAYSKKSGGLRCGGRYVRLTAAEKHEIIRLVEGSDLSVRRTLRELGVHRSTFYAWYRRYQAVGAAGLVPRPSARTGYLPRPPAQLRASASGLSASTDCTVCPALREPSTLCERRPAGCVRSVA